MLPWVNLLTWQGILIMSHYFLPLEHEFFTLGVFQDSLIERCCTCVAASQISSLVYFQLKLFCFIVIPNTISSEIIVLQFNKREISFPKWYKTFFYSKYFRSQGRKSKYVNQSYYSKTLTLRRNFNFRVIFNLKTVFSLSDQTTIVVNCGK